MVEIGDLSARLDVDGLRGFLASLDKAEQAGQDTGKAVDDALNIDVGPAIASVDTFGEKLSGLEDGWKAFPPNLEDWPPGALAALVAGGLASACGTTGVRRQQGDKTTYPTWLTDRQQQTYKPYGIIASPESGGSIDRRC